MDFQSRINQFRQGLSDQQDSYNRAMGNLGQMGRTVIANIMLIWKKLVV